VLIEGRNRVQDMRRRDQVATNIALALAAYGEELSQHYTANIQLTITGEEHAIDPAISEEAYLIGREAILNAFNHAHAKHIEVLIIYSPKYLRVCVSDNGRGIDPEIIRAGHKPGHWGLPGMRERARSIGGHLKIWSALDAGTQIDLTIPARFAYSARPASRSRGFGQRPDSHA
jgi:signal transduction histidine kinase